MSEIQRKKMCIYHGNCADGFGAAWVVRKALGSDVEFVAGIGIRRLGECSAYAALMKE